MTADLFLASLTEHLRENGLPQEITEKTVSYYKKRFFVMTEEDVDAEIEKLGGAKTVADKIAEQYKQQISSAAASSKSAPARTPSEEMKASREKANSMAALLEESEDKPQKRPPQKKKTTAGQKMPGKTPQKKPSSAAKKASVASSGTNVAAAIAVIVLLSIFTVILFAVIFVGLGMLMVLGVLALIAGVAGGAAVSFVGILYGITQLFSAVPIGLYEIGIGVFAAGLTMLVGILLYNFVVRLIPFTYKKSFVLLKFVIAKMKDYYSGAKGASVQA